MRRTALRAGPLVALPVVLPVVLPAVLLAVLLAVAGCGNPERRDAVGTVPQASAPVPPGPHLYCITNIGHTLTTFSLAARRVLPETARFLALDPVGPWFAGSAGYYLSRVESSGAGANALIRFDPRSTVELARLKFPPNSNPNDLLPLPTAPGVGWVALRGSTFDNFAVNGVSVVSLDTLRDRAFCDLNGATPTCDRLAPALGGRLTSLLGFFWDQDGCGGAGCAYAVVNNFDGAVRDGWLLVLSPDAQGRPVVQDTVALGRNPQLPLVRDGLGRLWVVDNGGFVHFSAEGKPGVLQVLDTADLHADPDGDGLPGTTVPIETAATCSGLPRPDPGCDPTGVYSLDGGSGWLTTFPDDVLRPIDLAALSLGGPDFSAPRATGPFFPATLPAPALYAGRGGFGQARLGELDGTLGTLLGDHDLQAGNGPVTCAEYDTP